MTDFLDQNGVTRTWGAIKVFFQGRAALTADDADKIVVIDNDVTETVNGGTYKQYKTLTLTNLATYVGDKIGSLFAPVNAPTFTGVPAAPTAAAATNTTQLATTAFVQQELSNLLGASDAMVFKGTVGAGGTIVLASTFNALATYGAGWTYKVIEAGLTLKGVVCEVGDMLIATVDRAGTGNVDADWTVMQANMAIPGSLANATIDGLIV